MMDSRKRWLDYSRHIGHAAVPKRRSKPLGDDPNFMNIRLTRVGSIALAVLVIPVSVALLSGNQTKESADNPAPVHMTAEQDHQRMMDLLHIQSLRPGADPKHPDAPNAVNYDEAKVNHYPLPDPLLLNNGRRVTTPAMWWDKRRPELIEMFDEDVYGRVPPNTPKVNWEAISVVHEMNGSVPVISKKLVGHV